MSPRRTARCRTCFRLQIVKRDGRLFRHTHGYGPNPGDLPICPGSNEGVRADGPATHSQA